jgi:hypothetical protein
VVRALLLSVVSGCVLPPLDLEGRACPCTDGYVCDTSRDVCVAGEGAAPAVGGGGASTAGGGGTGGAGAAPLGGGGAGGAGASGAGAGGSGSAYADLILSDGPLAYWRFGEPADALLVEDEVANKDGTSTQVVKGVPGAIAGDPDTAFSFDGAGAKVDIPDASELFTFAGTAHHTYELWFKPKPHTPIQFLLEKRTGADVTTRDGNTLLLYGDSLSPAIERWTTGSVHISSASPPTLDVWHHIAFTFDGQRARLYVDGATGSDPGSSPGNLGPNGSALTIGAANGGGSPFEGDLDEVAVYDRALSADEVFEHFTLGLGQ